MEKCTVEVLSEAYREALRYSRCGRVCLEQFIEGVHVSGDGFLVDGRFSCAAITKKYRKGFVVLGHSLPTDLKQEDQFRVIEEVERTCAQLDYSIGPLDFDAIVNEDGAWIIEMAPRLGGNGIPELIRHATGCNLIAAAIEQALGTLVVAPRCSRLTRSCASIVFGSDQAGILESIASPEELRYAVEEVLEYYTMAQSGDNVRRFSHGGHSMGYVLFDSPAGCSYDDMRDEVMQALHLKVTSSGDGGALVRC